MIFRGFCTTRNLSISVGFSGVNIYVNFNIDRWVIKIFKLLVKLSIKLEQDSFNFKDRKTNNGVLFW